MSRISPSSAICRISGQTLFAFVDKSAGMPVAAEYHTQSSGYRARPHWRHRPWRILGQCTRQRASPWCGLNWRLAGTMFWSANQSVFATARVVRNRHKPRWKKRVSLLSAAVRMIALVALLFGATLSHHAAMASDLSSDVIAHGGHAAHEHGGTSCDGSVCEPSHEACCVLGQCLLGMAPACIVLSTLPVAGVLSPAPDILVRALVAVVPLRPPARLVA